MHEEWAGREGTGEESEDVGQFGRQGAGTGADHILLHSFLQEPKWESAHLESMPGDQ